MSLLSKISRASQVIGGFLSKPNENVRRVSYLPEYARGGEVARVWRGTANSEQSVGSGPLNPLQSYFDGITEGPGVWKWRHYFEIYHRHLHKFVGRDVTVVEVGVYSGGSLPMWRNYFGNGCRIHGVDI